MSESYVFVHGSPGDASCWEPLLAHAPEGAQCHALDLLDHGAAADAPGASVDDVVADLVAQLAALPPALVLVGHSFGAWACGRAIVHLPGRVTRFVAIAGLPGIDSAVAERSAGFAAALEAGALTLEAAAQVACDLWLPTSGRRPEHERAITKLVVEDRAERLVRVLRRQTELADPARWVANHDVPAVSIHEHGDRAVPLELGRQLAARSARSKWIELPGDGHFPHWTQAADVARIAFAHSNQTAT